MIYKKVQEDITHGDMSFPVAVYETVVPNDQQVPLYYHIHKEVELLWILSGKADFWVNNNLITMRKGDILLIPVENVHGSYDSNAKNLVFRAVLINPVFLKSFFRDSVEENYLDIFFQKENVLCCIEQEKAVEIIHLLNQIYDYNIDKTFGYELMIKALLYQCIYKMLPYLSKNEVKKYGFVRGELMKNIVMYIENNYRESISLRDVAQSVSISKGYLCRFFKKNFNMTFSEYLTRVRIGNAEELLSKSDKTITEVALEVGFGNADYFTLCFKEYFHMTPREYRKKKYSREI